MIAWGGGGRETKERFQRRCDVLAAVGVVWCFVVWAVSR